MSTAVAVDAEIWGSRRFDAVRSGDVLAFYGHGLIATAIRFRTLSRCTHVGFALWFRGRLCVLEAREFKGVRLFPVGRYLSDPDLKIVHYELLDEGYGINRSVVVDSALSHWGKRYASTWQFLRSYGLVTRRMADRLGLAPDTNPERFYCSEYVQDSLREGGYKGEGSSRPPAETSPGDVLELPCLSRRGTLTL